MARYSTSCFSRTFSRICSMALSLMWGGHPRGGESGRVATAVGEYWCDGREFARVGLDAYAHVAGYASRSQDPGLTMNLASTR